MNNCLACMLHILFICFCIEICTFGSIEMVATFLIFYIPPVDVFVMLN